MKNLTLSILLTLIIKVAFPQTTQIDSLKHQLAIAKHDTSRALILVEISVLYRNLHPDSVLIYGGQALDLAQKSKFFKAEITILNDLGRFFRVNGNFSKSLTYQMEALDIAESKGYMYEVGMTQRLIGIIYMDLKDYTKAKNYLNKSLKISEKLGDKEGMIAVFLNIATIYRLTNQTQLSFKTLQKAQGIIDKTISNGIMAFYFAELGSTQFELGMYQVGLENQKKAVIVYKEANNLQRIATIYNTIALDFKKMNQTDSCIYYAQKGLVAAQFIQFKREILVASKLLAAIFEAEDSKKAVEYYKIAMQTNDDLYGANNVLELQKIVFEEQEKLRKAEVEQINSKNRFKQYIFTIAFFVASLIGYIFYKNNQNQKKANAELSKTLTQLKSTQTQLIQSEKLASLGELTAGIAHEIQNPLNFVNNFSELSVDLAKELKEEAEKPEIDKELIIDLATDLSQNQEKINHHGKRASSIVKGMLEHSRASSGVKELTDINVLADEFLRLAYHGLRAKDSNFNATLETHFDENLPKIEVIPQDIGRVLLNLINNAFYATNVGMVRPPVELPADVKLPTIIISTQQIDNQIIIKITDNGIGMNEATKAKIFQPFFTTKPTGQGTGLGLSLAYDIVTKGHGGTIEVKSVEGEGTTFIVKLPI